MDDSPQSAQQKFDFYVVGLVFTLLGASVQTAEFGASILMSGFELMSWLLLLVAGLLGLRRLEWMPQARQIELKKNDLTNERYELTRFKSAGNGSVVAADTGRTMRIDDVIESRSGAIKKLGERFDELNKLFFRTYSLARWFFVLGLCSLLVARAWEPMVEIAKAWPWTWRSC